MLHKEIEIPTYSTGSRFYKENQTASDFNMADSIVEKLASQGWAVADHVLDDVTLHQLTEECLQSANGTPGSSVAENFLNDRISMTKFSLASDAANQYLKFISSILTKANERLDITLSSYEGQVNKSPPRVAYPKHLDTHESDAERIVTCILYLNDEWKACDGGQLRLYLENDIKLDVIPKMGTFVAFLSGFYWHEVLPAVRERLSIPGWLK